MKILKIILLLFFRSEKQKIHRWAVGGHWYCFQSSGTPNFFYGTIWSQKNHKTVCLVLCKEESYKFSFWLKFAHFFGAHRNEKLKFLHNIHGDMILESGGKRSVWECPECGVSVWKGEYVEKG